MSHEDELTTAFIVGYHEAGKAVGYGEIASYKRYGKTVVLQRPSECFSRETRGNAGS